jgi:hypothetical protein
MWHFMEEWLTAGSLPDHKDLAADLKAVDYGCDASDAILLERKDDMRRRGVASPDDADALALTFAYPVAKRDWAEERRFDEGLQRLKRWIVRFRAWPCACPECSRRAGGRCGDLPTPLPPPAP